MTDTILFNGRMTTLDPTRPSASALAIDNGLFEAVGDDAEIMRRRGPKTTVVDLNRRTVIPGLNDSHTHLIRGGLNYNMELRTTGRERRCTSRRSAPATRAAVSSPQ